MRELRGTGERARVWDQRVGKGRVLVCSKFYRMADFVDRSAGGSRPSYGSRGEGVLGSLGMTGVVGCGVVVCGCVWD